MTPKQFMKAIGIQGPWDEDHLNFMLKKYGYKLKDGLVVKQDNETKEIAQTYN